MALNGLIACGVPQDWATHMIGHELTALYGVDHAQSLAVVLPGVLRHERERKHLKLLQYARRVWNILEGEGGEDSQIDRAIEKTEQFFHSLNVGTRFSDYQIPRDAIELVAKRLSARKMNLGEHGDLGEKAVREILATRS